MGKYSTYKLYKKWKTTDGINYIPVDEYQAVKLEEVSRNCLDFGDYDAVAVYKTQNEVQVGYYDSSTSLARTSKPYSVEDYDGAHTLQKHRLSGNKIFHIFWYNSPITMLLNAPITSRITTLYSMFDNCKNLYYVNTSNWDTSNVENMAYTFDTCISLESVDLSTLNTSSVSSTTYMFSGCSALTDVKFGGDFKNLKYAPYMFVGCKNIKHIDFGDADCQLSSDNYMFSGCTNLESIRFGKMRLSDNLRYENHYVFAGCHNLKTVVVNKNVISNVGYALASAGLTDQVTIILEE